MVKVKMFITIEVDEDEYPIPADGQVGEELEDGIRCLLYTSPSPRDGLLTRMPSSA